MKTLKIITIISFFLIGIDATAQVNNKKQSKEFQLIDTSGNEVISIDELIVYYKDKSNKKGERINAIVLFSELDTNKNGIVTLEEYINSADLKEGKKQAEKVSKKVIAKKTNPKKNQTSTTSALKKKEDKFYRIDTDKDKVISLKEIVDFNKGKRNKKGKLVESEVMFYGMDKNKDNKVTLEEFVQKIDWRFGRQRLKSIKNKGN